MKQRKDLPGKGHGVVDQNNGMLIVVDTKARDRVVFERIFEHIDSQFVKTVAIDFKNNFGVFASFLGRKRKCHSSAKIIAQRSRKRLVTFKCASVTAFGKAEGHEIDSDTTLVYATANEEDLIDYYAEFNHKSLGKTTVVFTPDSSILSLVVKSLPAQIRREAIALLDEIETDDEDEE